MAPEMLVETEQDRFQYTLLPKWIEFAGINGAWSRNKTLVAVFLALIRMDHCTAGLALRRGPDNPEALGENNKDPRIFEVFHREITQMVGCDPKTVGRYSKDLLEMGLLSLYVQGNGRDGSYYRINHGRLLQLYLYVAPLLRKMHGGIQNALPGDPALSTTRIYGQANSLINLTVENPTLVSLWESRPAVPQWPEPEMVRDILLGRANGEWRGDEPSPPSRGDEPSPPCRRVTRRHPRGDEPSPQG